MQTTHLYLTGYRGCGKSTIGKELSQVLDLPFSDLDDVIEQMAGQSIASIFDTEGESGFRDRESTCLKDISGGPPHVISLGGGAILREANRTVIAATGWCVWLDAESDVIAERLASDDSTRLRRPSLTTLPMQQEIETVMKQREPLYAAVANLKIETSQMKIEQILRIITDALARPE